MRTAKYHDYAILKVVIFFLIIVIGLFAYKTFVKTPCVHTAEGNSWITEKEATCTEDGCRYKKCSECGEHFDEQKISKLGHKVDDEEIVIEESTCTKQGTAYKACSVCKVKVGDSFKLPLADHTPGDIVVENELEHNATQGASYENVVYCTDCDYEFSREKVDVKHTVKTTFTDIPATCTENGTKYTTYSCVECDKVINIVETTLNSLGHDFEWELTYNGEANKFLLDGDCDECGHTYDPAVDTEYTFEVEKSETDSVAPSCISGNDTYIATICFNGVVKGTATLVIELDPVHNHTIITESGEAIDYMLLVQVDDYGKTYFNISTYGIYLVYTVEDGQTIKEAMNAEWDENGFAYGVFKCTTCNEWIAIRVFNDLAE
ncbi:MAG: hypothetical protein J6V80_06840 [Clostridia bacterium]|nr:hypothetical protein [Clostridia bacterium]